MSLRNDLGPESASRIYQNTVTESGIVTDKVLPLGGLIGSSLSIISATASAVTLKMGATTEGAFGVTTGDVRDNLSFDAIYYTTTGAATLVYEVEGR